MEPSDFSTDLRNKLENAGAAGLTKSKLIGRKQKEAREEALLELISTRSVANLGTTSKPRYVLAEYFKPLELAYEAVEKKATPGKATTYLEKELKVGTQGAVATKVAEAIELLCQENRLFRLLRPKRGKSTFYLHAASILPLVFPRPADRPEAPDRKEMDVEKVMAAYHTLVRETGYSDVRISELHRQAEVPLGELQAWLLAGSRAGTVAPTSGDWSLASEEQRAASLEINGEKYLRVRLL